MIEVKVDVKEAPYTIYLGSGIFFKISEELQKLNPTSALIVTNTTVGPLYGAQTLEEAQKVCRTEMIELPDGEQYKNWAAVEMILEKLGAMNADRKSMILALGGGVVGDMAGFASAIYMRGIPFIQIPTTLLAQVDSSVGGKTGINMAFGKNMVGAFNQPKAVIADSSVLRTLPPREVSAGIGEIIKHGLLADRTYFEEVEKDIENLRSLEAETVSRIVAGSCLIKAGIVAQDAKEKGIRAHLNLGHTFGHAIEKLSGYGTWLHGEAVGCGVVMAAEASRRLGHLSEADVERIRALVDKAGLPVRIPGLSAAAAVKAMQNDKKSESGIIRFVLMKQIGETYVDTLPEEILTDVLLNGGYEKS